MNDTAKLKPFGLFVNAITYIMTLIYTDGVKQTIMNAAYENMLGKSTSKAKFIEEETISCEAS